MKRAVLYLRVSTLDQTTANQERELREIAGRMGCEIVKSSRRRAGPLPSDVLLEAVTVREGGEIRQMSALEAVLKKILSKALSGDDKAALTIIGIAQKEGIPKPEHEEVVENLSESVRARRPWRHPTLHLSRPRCRPPSSGPPWSRGSVRRASAAGRRYRGSVF
jgi:hypothetical protein